MQPARVFCSTSSAVGSVVELCGKLYVHIDVWVSEKYGHIGRAHTQSFVGRICTLCNLVISLDITDAIYVGTGFRIWAPGMVCLGRRMQLFIPCANHTCRGFYFRIATDSVFCRKDCGHKSQRAFISSAHAAFLGPRYLPAALYRRHRHPAATCSIPLGRQYFRSQIQLAANSTGNREQRCFAAQFFKNRLTLKYFNNGIYTYGILGMHRPNMHRIHSIRARVVNNIVRVLSNPMDAYCVLEFRSGHVGLGFGPLEHANRRYVLPRLQSKCAMSNFLNRVA